jgi:hypothetical protein
MSSLYDIWGGEVKRKFAATSQSLHSTILQDRLVWPALMASNKELALCKLLAIDQGNNRRDCNMTTLLTAQELKA